MQEKGRILKIKSQDEKRNDLCSRSEKEKKEYLERIHKKLKLDIHKNISSNLKLDKIPIKELKSPLWKSKIEKTARLSLDSFESNNFTQISKEELLKEILNEILGLGAIEDFINDPNISEIMVNGKDNIYIERDGKLIKTGKSFSSNAMILSMLDRILSPLGKRIDTSSPTVDARLKDGSRVNAIIEPLSIAGPIVTIRKFSSKILSAEDLVEKGSLTKELTDFIEKAVKNKKNILISGGTGTGKTTLLNIISSFIGLDERIITIEDSSELRLIQPHTIYLESRPPNIEGRGEITIRDLLKNALRMRPDRIIVGECRGGEAIDMLQAMNTGHNGSMTTLHANSPKDALTRLETMVLMSGFDLPLRAIREQISSAIDLIIQLKRRVSGKRAVCSVTEICGTENSVITIQELFSSPKNFDGEDGPIQKTANIPKLFARSYV